VATRVVAGTVATDNAIRVRVTAVGQDTALAGIQRLVAEAQSSSTRAQLLADRSAGWLFWFALVVAVITVVVWSVLGTPESALVRAITVMVIACPHALGLAIPLVVSIATERAAKGGVLVKDRAALEQMRTVNTVFLDKTGTLTKGEPVLNEITTVGQTSQDDQLAMAAAVESDSEHPLARAIVAAARGRGLDVPRATEFHLEANRAVAAAVRGARGRGGAARPAGPRAGQPPPEVRGRPHAGPAERGRRVRRRHRPGPGEPRRRRPRG
jgi:P-type Cu2+ transporter